LIGREEERDILSSKILVASFVAHEIYQSLAAKGVEEAEEQARVTKLLRELIDDISVVLKSQRCRPNPFLSAKPRAWTVYWSPDDTCSGLRNLDGASSTELPLADSTVLADSGAS
jgi:hypothetical protein